MANGCWRLALALLSCAAVAVGRAGADPPTAPLPSTGDTAKPGPEAAVPPRPQVLPARPPEPPPRSRIDIERAIADAIARNPTLALPHFQEEVEVRDVHQEALEAHLRGVDLECGASESGPPTASEMNPYRGASIPPHADFLAAGREIAKGLRKLFGSKKPRYFLYAVRRAVAAPQPSTAGPAAPSGVAPAAPTPAGESVAYVVRENPIAENARSSVPGTRWELVASFRDRETAVAALDRLQRGFTALQRAHEDGRLPPWVSTTCRPPRIR